MPPRDPADATHENNDYVFERAVRKHKDEGETTEKKVGEVLASLARLGYFTSEDGKTFALRRVA